MWFEVEDVMNGKTENFENCIYMWRNKVNQKLYIGQAVDFVRRTKEHKSDSFNEKSKSYNYPIHNAIRKYGIENFEICILEKDLSDYDEMNEKEIYFIEKFDILAKNGKGYNVASGGKNGNPYAGKTEEEMMEIRKKMSEVNSGKHLSEETKRKISENHADISGENNPMYGRTGENNPMYGRNSPKSRKVICVTTGEIFYAVREAERQTGVNKSHISLCCSWKRKSAGKDENGNKLVWMYYDEYLETLK